MRTLLGPEGDLREVYAAPETPWLRVNMVSTIDGAATGESGLTASINNEPDQRVFRLLRELADCVVVGAGTARTEGYPPLDVPTVVVSRSGSVPEKMRGADPGRVLLATVSVAAGLEDARDLLGARQRAGAGLAPRRPGRAQAGARRPRVRRHPLRGRPAPAARPARPGRRRRARLHVRAADGGGRPVPHHRRPARRRDPDACRRSSSRTAPCSGAGSPAERSSRVTTFRDDPAAGGRRCGRPGRGPPPSVRLAPDVEAGERAERHVPCPQQSGTSDVGRVGPVGVAHLEDSAGSGRQVWSR